MAFAWPRALPAPGAQEVRSAPQGASAQRQNLREEGAYLVGAVDGGHEAAAPCCVPLLPGNHRGRAFQATPLPLWFHGDGTAPQPRPGSSGSFSSYRRQGLRERGFPLSRRTTRGVTDSDRSPRGESRLVLGPDVTPVPAIAVRTQARGAGRSGTRGRGERVGPDAGLVRAQPCDSGPCSVLGPLLPPPPTPRRAGAGRRKHMVRFGAAKCKGRSTHVPAFVRNVSRRCNCDYPRTQNPEIKVLKERKEFLPHSEHDISCGEKRTYPNKGDARTSQIEKGAVNKQLVRHLNNIINKMDLMHIKLNLDNREYTYFQMHTRLKHSQKSLKCATITSQHTKKKISNSKEKK